MKSICNIIWNAIDPWLEGAVLQFFPHFLLLVLLDLVLHLSLEQHPSYIDVHLPVSFLSDYSFTFTIHKGSVLFLTALMTMSFFY